MSSRESDPPTQGNPLLEVPDDSWTQEQVEDWLRRITIDTLALLRCFKNRREHRESLDQKVNG